MKKAHRCAWGGVVSIVAAETVAQARSTVVRAATDAGYKPKWIDVRVVRAPEYDVWAEAETKTCPCE